MGQKVTRICLQTTYFLTGRCDSWDQHAHIDGVRTDFENGRQRYYEELAPIYFQSNGTYFSIGNCSTENGRRMALGRRQHNIRTSL